MIKKIYKILFLSISSLSFWDSSPTFYFFGDSHTMHFSSCPDSKFFWLGPVTMHRIRRDGIFFENQIKEIAPDNFICFVFGEIDVRCHVLRIAERDKKNAREVAKELVQGYIEQITKLMKNYPSLYFVVAAVLPPADKLFNPEYPWHGLLKDRAEITLFINENLKNLAESEGIFYLDQYSDFVDSIGALDSAYTVDGVRLAGDAIIEKLNIKLAELKNRKPFHSC